LFFRESAFHSILINSSLDALPSFREKLRNLCFLVPRGLDRALEKTEITA